MENFIATQAQTNKEFLNQNIHTSEQIKQLVNKVDALATHNKMLETQFHKWPNNKHLLLHLLVHFQVNLNRIQKDMLMLLYCKVELNTMDQLILELKTQPCPKVLEKQPRRKANQKRR